MSTKFADDRSQSALRSFACALGYTEKVELRGQVWLGLGAVTLALAVLVWASWLGAQKATFWVFGLAFGFVLQRSRFCFASAFRDIFLLQHGRTLKGLLVGLVVATIGFGVMMSKQVPNTALGILPPDANVLPLGWHTILGGLMFGVGMVVAGGCVSGSIYRMGEGYLASWVSFGGIMLGLLAAGFTWNWWWDNSIAAGPRLWLPTFLGHGPALALTLFVLLLVFLLVLWWESRGGMIMPDIPFVGSDEETFAAQLNNGLKRFFVHGWSAVTGGAVLGGLNVLLFVYAIPWGFTGEVSRWSIGFSNWLGFGPGQLKGADSLPGCVLEVGGVDLFPFMFFLVVGMLFGSFIAALFAGEFKLRVPRQKIRYAQSFGGGTVMGYGAGIAMGCTIGSFFSSISSLAVNGWVFALFLAIGAWLGTKLLAHIP